MKLLTQSIRRKLEQNHHLRIKCESLGHKFDPFPLVKLFTPDAGATWLLTELDPDGDTAFGLCDLGLGCPEMGYVSLKELASIRGKLGLPIERDRHFYPTKPLSSYLNEALVNGCIST
jgi:hypothetical protein